MLTHQKNITRRRKIGITIIIETEKKGLGERILHCQKVVSRGY